MLVALSSNRVNRPDDSGASWIIRVSCMLLITVLVIPFFTWVNSLGNPIDYFQSDLPPGQIQYSLSKLAALYAIILLWLQMMYGLLKGNAIARYVLPRWSVNGHRLLGLFTLVTAITHFLLFFTAVALRTNTLPLHLLVPNFNNGFYTAAVSLGWFALTGMLVVAMIGLLRSNMQGIWLWAHRFSFGVIVLAMLHAQLVGSEAQASLWFFITLFIGVTVVTALLMRFRTVKASPCGSCAPATRNN